MLSLDDVIPVHTADIAFPEGHPLAGQRGGIFAFAVPHSEGLLLFETGIGPDNPIIERRFQPVRRPLIEALAEHGIHRDDVTAIVNSHLHFDHCGGNLLFPGVPIYSQEAEYEAAHTSGYTVTEWVDFPGAHYKRRTGDYEIVPGIEVLATAGHTAGHQSLLMATVEGPVILAGQAIYSRMEYDFIRTNGKVPPEDPAQDFPQDYSDSALRLIRLRSRRVFFSHDRAVWDARDHAL
jgi:N-acyl homoserine lactone hydrolase